MMKMWLKTENLSMYKEKKWEHAISTQLYHTYNIKNANNAINIVSAKIK